MKKSLIFLFGLLLSTGAMAQSEKSVHPHIQHYQDQIGLDDAQVEKVKAIYASSEAKLQEVSNELSTIRTANAKTYKSSTQAEREAVDKQIAELSAQRQQLETARKDEVKALLSDEQKALWAEKYETKAKAIVKPAVKKTAHSPVGTKR